MAKMQTYYIVRVNGRVFMEARTVERKDELVEILTQMYPNAEITTEKKRRKKLYTED